VDRLAPPQERAGPGVELELAERDAHDAPAGKSAEIRELSVDVGSVPPDLP
jgi:hypothetical protein